MVMRLMFRKRTETLWRAEITDTEGVYVGLLKGEWHAFTITRMNPGLRKHEIGTYETKLEATRAAAAYAERKLG